MPGLDVHEYLDGALMKIATDADFDLAKEAIEFNRTFALINRALGDSAFKRWNGNEFSGKFLMSVFEVVATGVAANIERIESLEDPNAYIRQRCIDLWGDAVFQKNSGAGVRGTTRLTNLLPMAESFFQK